MKKTVAQLVKEHQKRQEEPEFSTLVFENGRTYHNITNFTEIGDNFPEYEFDSEWNGIITHIHIGTSPVIKEIPIGEVPGRSDIIAKHCTLLHIYTESGKTEDFFDIYDLKETKKGSKIEFDFFDNDKKYHMSMCGKITKCIADIPNE